MREQEPSENCLTAGKGDPGFGGDPMQVGGQRPGGSQRWRAEGERFDFAPWVPRAKQMPREEFNGEVDRFLTGRESEQWELLYFKIYKSQLGVIERALETAGLMLGADKSRGYCLEMICADFLAGANIEEANPKASVLSLRRVFELLPREQPSQFLFEITSTSCLDQR